jgi:hypothetical protein
VLTWHLFVLFFLFPFVHFEKPENKDEKKGGVLGSGKKSPLSPSRHIFFATAFGVIGFDEYKA